MSDGRAFLEAELDRGPLSKDEAMLALAAWSARVQMGGMGKAQCAQLLMAVSAREIVDAARGMEEAAAIFNTLSADAARLLSDQANFRFGASAGAA